MCGLWSRAVHKWMPVINWVCVLSYPQPPIREHGCTVGVDRTHPCDAHIRRMMWTSERQLVLAWLLVEWLFTMSFGEICQHALW